MVFELRIFLLLAECRRDKHKCAWPNNSSTSTGSLISPDSLQFHFMLHVPSKAVSTRDFTFLLALMNYPAWLAKFCCFKPWFVA